ncbi:MAG TPA: Asp-tRNA(Asn)/Glu-tRNA(Gln) amidotransferase subunit GatC [Candidatus Paceibacterota bacterium]|nr:Asp-tRNA(Asn)/Glu-tRNA(Gln) amidotransferase subunit GatC [Candidatus Pacearchaeota archaeon]HRZ51009.1 Asp-tRNA(Asn)/Glu-tRNA(Gln) amidotransferase subunit GatC [Candidatus Paceibacterota bacterium]HSA36730.1 Asp-tRNA(Asn)/Glu-tRNA(Gln) amidotransferase subunit GatC [Candidatus Paceibacterota bacterium]
MLSKEETKHIAKLARLGLSETEIERYQKDLSSILDYIEKLKEVDIKGTKPFTHPIEISNITRIDKAKPQPTEIAKKLIDLMPGQKDGYLKVKSVFE